MPEVITITNLRALKPFDMIEEGVYIRSIRSDFTWEVATLQFREDEVDGTVYKSPVWGPALDIPMRFPVTVTRGVEPKKIGESLP